MSRTIPTPPELSPTNGAGTHPPRATPDPSSVGPRNGLDPRSPGVRVAAAPRQWRPKTVLVAALLVLLGGLGAAWAVPTLTGRVEVLLVGHDVRTGTVLTAAELTKASMSVDPRASVVRLSEADTVLGQTVLRDLSAGSVLSPADVGTPTGLSRGQRLVPLPLKPEQVPARGLAPGDRLLVVPAPTGAAVPVPGVQDATPVNAVVIATGAADPATGISVVDVSCADNDAVPLAKLAASGAVAVVVFPAGEAP